MRLYKQELLRIIKSTRTRVVIVLAILLPIVLALLATEFNDANYWDNDGNTFIHEHHRCLTKRASRLSTTKCAALRSRLRGVL